jgi:hypothetical protein
MTPAIHSLSDHPITKRLRRWCMHAVPYQRAERYL